MYKKRYISLNKLKGDSKASKPVLKLFSKLCPSLQGQSVRALFVGSNSGVAQRSTQTFSFTLGNLNFERSCRLPLRERK